ncbi:Dyp-type peroxidase [Vibrio sp. SS-MA-C1-2]|uniref:Dyp-type peroxidase n=1 Tax=Vibrio sp. SS-MA-C1-2 TaxID=2908646 RepID=UPI001F42E364|nr:Dyp-type peroxidase [Vibrio sp. SS-MA-C1-2]UJF19795.1 Dyp-type peroxidase [Vibrio sp. SS-MA-C1-2]
MNEQSGIIPLASPFALYATMSVIKDSKAVLQQCQALAAQVSTFNQRFSGSELSASVAFSHAFWQQFNVAMPAELIPFPAYGSGEIVAPSTSCDLLLHVHSVRHDLNFALLKEFIEPISDKVKIEDETYGFRYLDSRDMTDFIDGTENPTIEQQRRDVALVADGEHAGGSYVMLQRFIHTLSPWSQESQQHQEQVIGRTKDDSVELEDVPPCSHVGRVDLKEDGKGLKIVRHSLPYGTVSGDHGLLFIAYCHSIHNFDAMLKSMYGEGEDGQCDQLLNYTKAVTGSYLFAPSLTVLDNLSIKS